MRYCRESGSCTGRGFSYANPAGFLAKFKTWCSGTYPNGAGWTIIDDESMDPNYGKFGSIVNFTNETSPIGSSGDTVAKWAAVSNGCFAISISGVTRNLTNLNFTTCSGWAGIGQVITTALQASGFAGATCLFYDLNGYTGSSLYYLRRCKITAGTRGNAITLLSGVPTPTGPNLSHAGWLGTMAALESNNTNPFIVICSSGSPTPYDASPAKFIKIGQNATAGYIFVETYLYWDATTHTGHGLWSRATILTEDAGLFVYDFRGGDQAMIIQSFKSSVWYSFILDEWLGDAALVEPVSGSIFGWTQTEVLSGNYSVTLNTGAGASFTPSGYYYLMDLKDAANVNYLSISGVAGDVITFNEQLCYDIKTSGILSPYLHRFYSCRSNFQTSFSSYREANMPYKSVRGLERRFGVDSNQTGNGCYGETLLKTLTQMAPDDAGKYACMKPIISETSIGNDYGTPNRAYGAGKNLMCCFTAGMNPATDGRIISGKNFLYFKTHTTLFPEGQSTLAVLVPDYNENT